MANRFSKNKIKSIGKRKSKFEKLEPRIMLAGDLLLDGIDTPDFNQDVIVQNDDLLDGQSLSSSEIESQSVSYQPEEMLVSDSGDQESWSTEQEQDVLLIESTLSAGAAATAISAQTERNEKNEVYLGYDADNTLISGSVYLDDNDSLTGSGAVEGLVINEGLVAPGNSPGVQIVDSYAQMDSGTLLIEVGGMAAGGTAENLYDGYDQLNVSNHAELDGALEIRLLNDFNPDVGAQFDILTFGTVSGGFDQIQGLYLGEGKYFSPTLNDAGGITLIVEQMDFVSQLQQDAGVTEAQLTAGLSAVDQLMSALDLRIDVADPSADLAAQLDSVTASLDDLMSQLYTLATDEAFSGSVDFSGQVEFQGQYLKGDFSLSAVVNAADLSANEYQLAATNMVGQADAGGVVVALEQGAGQLRLTQDGVAGYLSANVAVDGVEGVDARFTGATVSFNETASDLTVLGETAEAGQAFRVEGDASLALGDVLVTNGHLVLEKQTSLTADDDLFLIGATDLTVNTLDAAADQLGVRVSDVDLMLVLADGINESGYAFQATGAAALSGLGAGSSLSLPDLQKTLILQGNHLGRELNETLTVNGQDIALVFGADQTDVSPSFEVQDATFNVDGLGELSGDFRFEFRSQGSDADSNGLADQFNNQLIVTGSQITGQLSEGGVTLDLSSGQVALVFENHVDGLNNTSTEADWSVSAKGDLSLSGIPSLELSGSDLNVVFNGSGKEAAETLTLADGSELNLALTADTGLSVTGTMAGTLSDVGSVAGDILLLKNAAGEYSFDASRLELPVLGELVGDLSFDLNPQTDAQNTVTSLFADEVV
ncbi:MAG: LEPR-XLL domain-containing protein, partial [Oceanospirillum sp.]|nr:LEPR-XLL domain-containing protein [Oceanospirillum sp.]